MTDVVDVSHTVLVDHLVHDVRGRDHLDPSVIVPVVAGRLTTHRDQVTVGPRVLGVIWHGVVLLSWFLFLCPEKATGHRRLHRLR
jgi:hypothetical protein